ncbi:MAG: GrpB family protein [Thermomicrobiales bacterium]
MAWLDGGGDPIVVMPYAPEWPARFRELAAAMRRALGDVAVRIDHIGSTAIPGLAAKPIIDLQISVASLEPVAPFRDPLERLGYVWRSDNPDRTKRYFREAPGTPRTHIHVRQHGSWSEQFALLFRDYLRASPEIANQYAAVKYDLAERYRHDRQGYVDAKDPFIWSVMAEASDWSQEVGWEPGSSDR